MASSQSLYMFESKYFKTYTNSIRLIGLWPFQANFKNRAIRCVISFMLVTFIILQSSRVKCLCSFAILFFSIRFYEELDNDLDIVLELVGSISYFLGCILKYLTTIQAQPALQYLYEQMQGHCDVITNEKEKEIMEMSARDNQFLSKLYMGAAYAALAIYTTVPVAAPLILDIIMPLNESHKKIFPYYIEYFIDTDAYYYQLIFHGTMCFSVSVVVYVSIDTMYAACVQHLCGLLDIVEHRLKEAMDTSNGGIVLLHEIRDENVKRISKLIHEAIKLHQESIEFSLLIEKTYAICFFLVLNLNLAVIVVVAVDIVINLDSINQIIRLSILYVAFSFHLFFTCASGQKISDKSIGVMNSAYFAEWYHLSLNSRSLIQFVIQRSFNPCQFTAGGLFVLNMEIFGSIMKSSMSYVTVLASLR